MRPARIIAAVSLTVAVIATGSSSPSCSSSDRTAAPASPWRLCRPPAPAPGPAVLAARPAAGP